MEFHTSSSAPDLSSFPVPLPREEGSKQREVSLAASSGHPSTSAHSWRCSFQISLIWPKGKVPSDLLPHCAFLPLSLGWGYVSLGTEKCYFGPAGISPREDTMSLLADLPVQGGRKEAVWSVYANQGMCWRVPATPLPSWSISFFLTKI